MINHKETMKIKRLEFNMFPVNCYVLWDDTKEAVVIDPGCFYEEEKQALKKSVSYTHLDVYKRQQANTGICSITSYQPSDCLSLFLLQIRLHN